MVLPSYSVSIKYAKFNTRKIHRFGMDVGVTTFS